jgi:hypothetical protein
MSRERRAADDAHVWPERRVRRDLVRATFGAAPEDAIARRAPETFVVMIDGNVDAQFRLAGEMLVAQSTVDRLTVVLDLCCR